jgi:uncharacterized protein (DUF952 family)
MENRFFKILTPAQWQNFQSERVFLGSELDQQDGFIHLSLQSQWNRIWQKFFNADECYLLEIDGYSLNPEALKIPPLLRKHIVKFCHCTSTPYEVIQSNP